MSNQNNSNLNNSGMNPQYRSEGNGPPPQLTNAPGQQSAPANLLAQQQLFQYYQQFFTAAQVAQQQQQQQQQQQSGQGKPPPPPPSSGPSFPPYNNPGYSYYPQYSQFQPPPPPPPAQPEYESTTDSVYITGLPSSVTEKDIEDKFGSIGILKTDKKTREKKIQLYKDRVTNLPKGDAMVTYEDPDSATAAISWFNGAEFMGSKIQVQMAQRKADLRSAPPVNEGRPGDWICTKCGNQNWAKRTECNKCKAPKMGGGGPGPMGRGSGGPAPRGGGSGPGPVGRGGRGGNNAVAEPGDWICPKSECANVNFARRDTCNRCGVPRPGGVVAKGNSRYERRDRPY